MYLVCPGSVLGSAPNLGVFCFRIQPYTFTGASKRVAGRHVFEAESADEAFSFGLQLVNETRGFPDVCFRLPNSRNIVGGLFGGVQ